MAKRSPRIASPARRSRRAPEPESDGRDLREAILEATSSLLAERRFDQIAVADILAAAGVSRGSFYFYFDSKHDALAELVSRAMNRGQDAAQPWLQHDEHDEAVPTVRSGIEEGAKLWREQAPVLRAIVENWQDDPRLTQLWLERMGAFAAATIDRINIDHANGAPSLDADVESLAAALCWLGERLYYLAAIGIAPFDDQDALVDVLTYIWQATLYPDERH